jgi:Domain of unknown function (DUF4349)
MQPSEAIDERYADLARELRSLPGAPPALRTRVLRLAEQPEPESRWKLKPPSIPFRYVGYGLAGCAAALVAGAIGYGVVSSGPTGSGSTREAARGVATTMPQAAAPKPAKARTVPLAGAAAAPPPPATFPSEGAGQDSVVTLPPSRGRLAQYRASMTLRVKNVDRLSSATRAAMRITRRLGGFVASVNFGTPRGDEGDSYLRVRVPVARIQEALVKFSQLGTITAQQVSIIDVQDRVNQASLQIAHLQDRIGDLRDELKGSLSAEQRVRLEQRLAAARAELRALTQSRKSTVRSARLATITLELTTRKSTTVAHPSKPGRIERAATGALDVLAWYGVAVIYALIVVSPLVVLLAAAGAGRRAARRRSDARVLESA